MAGSYLSKIDIDDTIVKVNNAIKSADPSSLTAMSSLYSSCLDSLKSSFASTSSELAIGDTWDDAISATFNGTVVSEMNAIIDACRNPAVEILNVTAGDTANLIDQSNNYIKEVESHNEYYGYYVSLKSQEPEPDSEGKTSHAAWRNKMNQYENYLKSTFENSEIYKDNSYLLMDNIKNNLSGTATSASTVSIDSGGVTSVTKPEIPEGIDQKDDTSRQDSLDRQNLNNTDTTVTGDVSGAKKGTTTVQHYTDPVTGKTLTYKIFIPEGTDATKLPVTLYLDNGNNGLYNEMDKKTFTASGIIVYVDSHSASKFGGLRSDSFLTTCKSLTDSVVQTYNGDSNRISVSGFSLGGQAAFQMTVKYPGYFAVSCPLSAKVSGHSGATDGFREMMPAGGEDEWLASLSKTKVVAFCGNTSVGGEDRHVTWRQKELEQVMKNKGYNSFKLNVIDGLGHRTWKTYLWSSYGGYPSVLEYMFAQTKA